jgi:hypothetical protein
MRSWVAGDETIGACPSFAKRTQLRSRPPAGRRLFDASWRPDGELDTAILQNEPNLAGWGWQEDETMDAGEAARRERLRACKTNPNVVGRS